MMDAEPGAKRLMPMCLFLQGQKLLQQQKKRNTAERVSVAVQQFSCQ
jgi:hypothetical protein